MVVRLACLIVFVAMLATVGLIGKPRPDEGLAVALGSAAGAPCGGAIDKVAWAAVGVDLVPQATIRLTVKCKDPEEAKELRDKWQLALAVISKLERVRTAVPEIEKLLPALLPKIKGSRLILSLDEQHEGWGSLIKLLSIATAKITGGDPIVEPQKAD